MGIVGSRQSRAAMLSAKSKGENYHRIFRDSFSPRQAWEMRESYWHKLHITSARGSFSLFKQWNWPHHFFLGPEPASDCAHEAQIWKWG
jgi:hypothetical protein